jgi:antitoxin CptB
MIDHDDPCGPDWDLPARQARWRSRRGLLELDLLLPEFAAHEYLNLAPELRRAYARLLDCDDHDIWEWYRGHSLPDSAELVELIKRIRAYHDR